MQHGARAGIKLLVRDGYNARLPISGGTMRSQIRASIYAVLLAAGVASAQAADAESQGFAGTVTFLSDYRFRGMSQNYGGPGLIADMNWTFQNGIYVGTWLANVSRNQFQNGRGLETDIYAGYKAKPWADTEIDVGLFQWFFPRAAFYSATLPQARRGDTKYSTLEAYAGIAWKGYSARYSRTVGNWFGVHTPTYGGTCGMDSRGAATANCFSANPGSSKGSEYLEFGANFDLGESLVLDLHLGHQWVRNYAQLNYSDYKLGLTRDFGWASVGLSLVGTNANAEFYRSAPLATLQGASSDTRLLGGHTLMLSVAKSF